MNKEYTEVLSFWFQELTPEQWFKKDPEIDHLIKKRFGKLHEAASRGELFYWRDTASGRLAEILLLDQFSRNIHRDSSLAFTNDTVALVLSQEMIYLKLDEKLDKTMRRFVYMPFMHSESKIIHETIRPLFQSFGDDELLKFELLHKEIIDEFGRYPHRNKALSRTSTKDELKFMEQHPGF